MIIHREYQQRSIPWILAHIGVPTASEFGQLLTKKLEVSTGETPTTYLAKKVAEKWLDDPLPQWKSAETEQGTILETEPFDWYEFNFDEAIDRVGFCTSDDGRIGCSPDGIIKPSEDGKACEGGIEIKCPQAHTHTKYLLKGEVPEEYLPQIHGSMLVTGAKWWKFLSWRRGFPTLIKTVFRDEEILDTMAEALALFLARLDSAMNRLEEMNGGPTPHVSKLRAVAKLLQDDTPKFSWETDDHNM